MVLSSSLLLLASCDYSAPPNLSPTQGVSTSFSASSASPVAPGDLTQSSSDSRGQEERTAILDSVMTLIQRAAVQPGNENFKLAIQKLNHYFVGTTPSSYRLESESREFLRTQLPPGYVNELESQNWTLRDARHVEDCMMYYGIATRVAGSGSQLERVQRLFEWVVRQIQLVPPWCTQFSPAAASRRASLRRATSGHGYRGRRLVGRANVVVYGSVPSDRSGHRAGHIHEKRYA